MNITKTVSSYEVIKNDLYRIPETIRDHGDVYRIYARWDEPATMETVYQYRLSDAFPSEDFDW